jgi:polyisoprenoid-binding protein YceI
VYHALKGRDAQVTFTSDAPLEHIKGTSNEVIGYIVRAPGDTPRLVSGEFHLPVASLDTGIPMRNEHLQDARWLDAAMSPDVVFMLAETADVKESKRGDGYTAYDATLVGDMTIKGQTREVRIPATITLMPESDKTKARAPGDLMAIRAAFPVRLSDYSVASGDPALEAGKVSDEITLDVRLFLSDVSPEEMIRQRQQRQQQPQQPAPQNPNQGR